MLLQLLISRRLSDHNAYTIPKNVCNNILIYIIFKMYSGLPLHSLYNLFCCKNKEYEAVNNCKRCKRLLCLQLNIPMQTIRSIRQSDTATRNYTKLTQTAILTTNWDNLITGENNWGHHVNIFALIVYIFELLYNCEY